uniref:Integrase catalytic domain-containing protein n=1 Tax=Trichogramma kaykai TaxID=54128 RepID=A0ABD2W601_9HYME
MNPTERANRTLKTMIAAYVGANHREWDKHLHELRHAINTAVQSSTRVSPAFLNYGRHPRPVKSLRREVEAPTVEYWEFDETVWLERISRLDAIRDLVKLHLDRAHARQVRHYNRGRKDVRFAKGDIVMRRTHHFLVGADGFNKKLASRYEGPVKVLEVLSPSIYVVETPNDKRVAKVDVNDLKRYIPPRKTDTQIACAEFVIMSSGSESG